jgi:nicotinamidase-related amidase
MDVRHGFEVRDRSGFKAEMNRLLVIDPGRTVVLTVDMQRDYLDLEVASAPVTAADAERVLKHTADLLSFARICGMPVVHVYSTRRPVEIERGFQGTPLGRVSDAHGVSQAPHTPVRGIPDRLVGSPQSEVPAALVDRDDIHVTTKKVLDSYLYSDLDAVLGRVFKPETVVLTGVNTDTCVYSTAFSTSNRGYRPVVISDCVASMRGEDSHYMALELMARSIAWVLTVEEFKAKVRGK